MLLFEKAPRLARQKQIVAIVVIAAVYLVTARLGLLLAVEDGVVTAVWPPSGVALAALLIYGRGVWPGIWLGSFVANLWPLLERNPSPNLFVAVIVSAILAAGSTGAAWFSARILGQFSQAKASMTGVRQVGSFLLYGGLLGCLISSINGATALCLSGLSPMAAWLEIWLTWWMGDALGVLLFTPVLLVWVQRDERFKLKHPVEAVVGLSLLTAAAAFIFTTQNLSILGVLPDDIILLPPLIWAALRFGYRGATLGLVSACLIAIWGTAHGYGPYARPTLNQSLIALDLTLLCLISTGMSVTAVMQQWKDTQAELTAANLHLEDRVTQRTQELVAITDELRAAAAEQIRVAEALRVHTQLAVDLNRATTIYEASELISDVAEEIIGWDAAVLIMFDVSTGLCRSVLNIDTLDGVKRNVLSAFNDKEPSPRMRKTIEQGAELILRVSTDEPPPEFTMFGNKSRRSLSLIYVPIRDGKSVIGMFSVQSYTQNAYTKADLDMLQTMADQCAAALSRISSRELLRQSRDQLLEAQKLAHLGNFIWKRNSEKLSWSDELYHLHGYEINAVVPTFELCLKNTHDDDRERMARAFDSITQKGIPLDEDFRIRLPNGKTRWLHALATASINKHGIVVSVEGTCHDITERKQVADKLALFRTLIDSVNDCIEVIEPETGRFIDANNRWCEEHGYSREEMLKLTVLDVDARLDKARYDANYAHIVEQGRALYESIHRRKDGSEFPVEVSANYHVAGRSYLLAVIRNVTERKKVENELKDRTERLRLALEVAHMGSWDWDLSTNVVVSDIKLHTLFGGPTANHLEKEREFFQFIHPEDAPVVNAEIERALKETSHYQASFRVIWKDSSTHWMEGRGSVFRDDAGKPIRMVGVTVDITERVEAEKLLRASEQQFSDLVNNIDGIVWEADVQTFQMSFVSQQAERLLGYPAGDWIESKTFWSDHIHPDDRDQAVSYCVTQTQLCVSHDFEYRMIAADGRTVWMRDLVAVTSKDGKPVSMRGIMVDITQRKQAEAALKRSEGILRTVLDNAPVGIWMQDHNGRLQFVNQTFCKATGITEKRFLDAAHYSELFDPQVGAACMDSDRDALASDAPVTSREPFPFCDGKLHDLEIVKARINNPDMDEGLIGIAVDITERLQAESALKASEARYKQLFDAAPDAILLFGVEGERPGQILAANQAAAQMHGYSIPELMTMRIVDLNSSTAVGNSKERMKQILNGERLSFEIEHRRKDGSIILVEVRAEATVVDNRICALAFDRDITDRKRAEAALRESDERLQIAIEAANVGPWEWDMQNDKARYSPQWRAQLGLMPDELEDTNESWINRLHPEDAAHAIATMNAYAKGVTPYYENEFRLRHKDGTYRWIFSKGRSLKDGQGRPTHIVGCHVDLTERKNLEAAQAHAHSLLQAAIESSNEGLLVVDSVGKVTLYNKKFVEFWRLPDELVASRDDDTLLKHVINLIKDPDVFISGVKKLYGHPDLESYDLIELKDGRYCERYSQPHRLGDKIVGRVWSFRDITERKVAADKIQRGNLRLKKMSKRLIDIQESERRHLARELHDELGQTLTATKIILQTAAVKSDMALEGVRINPPKSDHQMLVTEAIGYTDSMLNLVRNLSLNLRPPMLDDFGLVSALRWLVDQHVRTTDRVVEFESDPFEDRFSPAIETACFRIAQEALTNVSRYSKATKVNVTLRRHDEELLLTIRDDGVGFDVEAALKRTKEGDTLGLSNLQERASLIGGHLEFITKPGAGTEVRATFPLDTSDTTFLT